MKVTVERAALLKSVGHVHRVVERRNTFPILANVLIRAEKGKLALKATDLDLEVIETIPAEVSPAGATTVLHAVRKIENLVGNDTTLAEEIELLKRLLQE